MLDELLEFISNNPKYKSARYTDGTNILISYVKIEIANNKPYCFLIGINIGAGNVKEIRIEPKRYYFFKNDSIKSVENPDDLAFWS